VADAMRLHNDIGDKYNMPKSFSATRKIILSLFPNIKNFPSKIKGIGPFIRDYDAYKRSAKSQSQPIPAWRDLYPQLDDRYQTSGGIPQHYHYQDIWAAKQVYLSKVELHHDIGSSIIGFVAHISVFCEVNVIDIRPQPLKMDNVSFIQGDITDLRIESDSIASLSCLHAAEHIGLGRYGDTIDPMGSKKAALELQRVLAKDGNLYFSVPIGKERICFNAHRIFYPSTILEYFNQLKLVSFSVVNDADEFIENINPADYRDAEFSCGLFNFKK